jgi:hypothetical protein
MICICKTGNGITHPEVARARRPLRGVDGMYILWEEMVSSLDWLVRVGIKLAKYDLTHAATRTIASYANLQLQTP